MKNDNDYFPLAYSLLSVDMWITMAIIVLFRVLVETEILGEQKFIWFSNLIWEEITSTVLKK